jgi:hypothetical protein
VQTYPPELPELCTKLCPPHPFFTKLTQYFPILRAQKKPMKSNYYLKSLAFLLGSDWAENPRVGGSIPSLGTIFYQSGRGVIRCTG